MLRWAIVAAVAVLAALGIAAAFTQPPKLLSILDGAVGGGRGTRQMGDGIAFGTHGQRLDVWRPAVRADDPRPVVVFFYGGGWVKGTRDAYAFAARAYASQGFVVIVPDYRKVPGVRFPAFVQDGAQAVRWTRDHIAEYGGDPTRIALAGHSAGSHTVAMLALDPRFLRAEGVDPGIVKAGVGLSGPYDFYPFTGRAVEAMKGADPLATQPIAFARAGVAPLLLVTSSNDTVVRPKNARNLAIELRRVGAPVEYRNYTGLTHEDVAMALSKPFRGKAPILTDSVAFLNRAMPAPRR
ncbi:alpha/beta hydrolase [Sphingomonas donggukensis]|uniref:Alpha/beta hydrolase n=1 Tax=Sphingomonas donggukensis TaxID=2949093 RepID=A0ABY4TV07_9SPHN|nr:alpha/beta hydrolase [Sphingomonas donggukensis]URW74406.1 alpha/beta hydrolase [Sphingomonas donggukensis]